MLLLGMPMILCDKMGLFLHLAVEIHLYEFLIPVVLGFSPLKLLTE
jgi:hypothetical protein